MLVAEDYRLPVAGTILGRSTSRSFFVLRGGEEVGSDSVVEICDSHAFRQNQESRRDLGE